MPMNNQRDFNASDGTVTRRRLVASAALLFGAFASSPQVLGSSPPPMTEAPSTGPNKARCTLHQEVYLPASPQRIYEALLDSKSFTAFSGMPAEIGHEAGAAISMFGRRIVGRNIELVPARRIVQAWRPADWDPGIYSIVKFELTARGSQSKVVLDHTGFPEGTYDHLNTGWPLRYWDPLRKYLA
jgi:activator of HSP90 ATPase